MTFMQSWSRTLGEYPSVYASWVANVKQIDGQIGGPPSSWKGDKTLIFARYPAEVWVPRVNAKLWAQPLAYLNPPKGQTRIAYAPGKWTTSVGYYLAPPAVQAVRGQLRKASSSEIDAASGQVKDPLGIGGALNKIAIGVTVAAVSALVLPRVLDRFLSRGRR